MEKRGTDHGIRMKIAQRVILNTLQRKGDFLGRIVEETLVDYVCVVKLDIQDELVDSVVYYDERPEVVDTIAWQICYPVRNE